MTVHRSASPGSTSFISCDIRVVTCHCSLSPTCDFSGCRARPRCSLLSARQPRPTLHVLCSDLSPAAWRCRILGLPLAWSVPDGRPGLRRGRCRSSETSDESLFSSLYLNFRSLVHKRPTPSPSNAPSGTMDRKPSRVTAVPRPD